jgi:hypothetical protein
VKIIIRELATKHYCGHNDIDFVRELALRTMIIDSVIDKKLISL